MAKRMKSNVKFSNVDILSFMDDVVQKHTKQYQSDFEIDKEILYRAADSQEQQDRVFVWLCRTAGTWCLLERNVFLKDTSENSIFNFYMEQTSEPILAYLIEIASGTQDSVMGNVYALNYAEYYRHIHVESLDAETIVLKYEHGCRTKMAYEHINGYPDTDYGKLVSVQCQPHSQEELSRLLWSERQGRDRFKEENPAAYIADL